MKTTRIMLLAAVLLGALPAMGSAATSISAGLHIGPSGHARVDIGFFYDDLASYGHWIERPRYGWVWTPRAVSASWRPYQAGHWVWTDLGWTWVSDEPYGWATYHYGRWYDDPDYGWEWVPGEEWAPAWVDWQEGNDYVGWAPLPPSVDFRPGVELNVSLAPDDFVFVPERNFLDLRVARYAVPRWESERIYRGTRNFTRYQRVNNRIFNTGIPVERVQRFTGRAVPRYQLADQVWSQRHQQRIARNQVAMFRPQVERARVAAPSARPIARRAVLAGAAATAAVSAHRAFRAEQAARQQPQGVLRQQERAQRQNQQRAQVQQQQQGRQQQRLLGRQQRQAVQGQQQQARIQQQQGRAQRQMQAQQQQQSRQLQRVERQQQQRAQQQARIGQQQLRSQRQVQAQQQQLARQQERSLRQQQQQSRQQARSQQQQDRSQRQQQQQARQQERAQRQQDRSQWQAQRQQQQQARQQERAQRQAQVQQQRPQRQFQQAQQQQARQQARQQRQQQGNPGQGQGNHHRQRPPQ